jgi:hypothetical protein
MRNLEVSMSGRRRKNKANSHRRPVEVNWITGTGLMYTRGMGALGFPDLEICNVPGLLVDGASQLLRAVCYHMISTGATIRPGQAMAISEWTSVRFVSSKAVPGEEDVYGAERLQIVVIEPVCECCGIPPSELNSTFYI